MYNKMNDKMDDNNDRITLDEWLRTFDCGPLVEPLLRETLAMYVNHATGLADAQQLANATEDLFDQRPELRVAAVNHRMRRAWEQENKTYERAGRA